ncbi:TolC family protein [Wenyingzhuangia sp. 2_MG-2023]|uniref:TolC family protein n=1 Tax=Wenyingzhuangia sp. 2_MG-2023 TaxID=3062639 RepID=UPI0026E2161F|nr:TolC family protein [Wenyingzhuangia sp. 2_MG-2023]MDO6738336.1 TolC family protein [Wenyingzhuangia sp. 2_MG-2023]
MKKTLLLVCIILGIGANAQDSKTYKLSLKEAVDYALKNNRTVKNAALSIQAAKQQKWETTAIGLPQINAKAEYKNYVKYPLTGVEGGEDSFINFIFPKQSLTPSVTLTQLLFDGSYIVGLQSAKVFLDITKNAKAKTDNEITKGVTSAYNNVLLTQESINLIQKNIASIKSNLFESKAMLTNGFIEEEDIEQLQITLNNLENNLNSLERMHTISLKLLRLTLGFTDDVAITLTEDLQTLISQTKQQATSFTDFSVFKNIDYQIAENEVNSKKLLYKLEQAKLLPTVSSFLTGNYIGNSSEFTFFDKSQNWIGTAMLGVTIDIPIFSSFASNAKRKRAKIDWQISQNKLIDTEEQIEINYQTIKSDLELAINTLDNKKRNLELAERIEHKNNIKYKEGISSSFDLRQAQMQLYSSQQEYLQAMVNVINKKAELNVLQN